MWQVMSTHFSDQYRTAINLYDAVWMHCIRIDPKHSHLRLSCYWRQIAWQITLGQCMVQCN
jgi:hypothetical protein